jgi:prophage regulatory protein
MSERLLDLTDVRARTTLSRSAIYKAIADGDFLRPVRVSSHRVSWVESEVGEWIARRIAERAAVGQPRAS